jgi:hypothetical protein
MKQFLRIILFLPLFTSLGTGAQYGLDDHPAMPKAVEELKQVLRTLKKFENMPERNEQQERDYREAVKECDKKVWRIVNCGREFEDYDGKPLPPLDFGLMQRRMEATKKIGAEILPISSKK